MSHPLISICIPVFKTEALLESCIASVIAQDFKQMEIIIVDDCSIPDQGLLPVSKIVKKLKKTTKLPLKLLQHSTNQGLVEARRTAIYAAKGEYIFNLDSDDTLPPNAIKTLFDVAQKTNADIIQGMPYITGNASPEILKKREDEMSNGFVGTLTNEGTINHILNSYILEHKISGYLWGKLIRREVYLEALNRIPPIACTFAEDVIQSLWIYHFAKSFVGLADKVYNYSIQSGISSKTIITDLLRWEKVCTTASVFTAIITECEENGNPFTEEQMDALRILCQKYVANNLLQLEKAVAPEIKEDAYKLLCFYWGEDLVETIKAKLEKTVV